MPGRRGLPGTDEVDESRSKSLVQIHGDRIERWGERRRRTGRDSAAATSAKSSAPANASLIDQAVTRTSNVAGGSASGGQCRGRWVSPKV